MIRISLQVGSDARGFDVTVRASDIAEAVNLIRTRYPGKDVRVEFPIHPEYFFVRDTARPSRPKGAGSPAAEVPG